MAEGVEDDLHGCRAAAGHRRQRLVAGLDTNAVVGDHSVSDERIERVVSLITRVDGGRWAVQLNKIQLIHS